MGYRRRDPDRPDHPRRRRWHDRRSREGIAGESRKLVGAWFSADGRQIMGIGPRTNRAWDAATGRPLSAGASPPPDTVAVTEQTLVTSSQP